MFHKVEQVPNCYFYCQFVYTNYPSVSNQLILFTLSISFKKLMENKKRKRCWAFNERHKKKIKTAVSLDFVNTLNTVL